MPRFENIKKYYISLHPTTHPLKHFAIPMSPGFYPLGPNGDILAQTTTSQASIIEQRLVVGGVRGCGRGVETMVLYDKVYKGVEDCVNVSTVECRCCGR